MTKNKTSIIFTGDIGFDRYMDKKWEDEQLLSQEVLDYFHSADHCVANVEGALIAAEDDGSRGVLDECLEVLDGAVYLEQGFLGQLHHVILSIGA